jgi:hypothetical protein
MSFSRLSADSGLDGKTVFRVLAVTTVIFLVVTGFWPWGSSPAFAQESETGVGETRDEDDNFPVPPAFKIRPIMSHPPILYGDMNNDGIDEMVVYREKRGEEIIRITIFFFANPPDEAVNGAVNVVLEDRRVSFAEPHIGDVDGDGNKDLVFFVQIRVPNQEGNGWRKIRFAVEAIDFHGNSLTGFPKFIAIDPETADLNFTTVEDPDSAVPEE